MSHKPDDFARSLMALEIDEAVAAKWQRGRDEFGDEWAGDVPSVEAHTELIDLFSYLKEMQRQQQCNTADLWPTVRFLIREIRRRHLLCEGAEEPRLQAPDQTILVEDDPHESEVTSPWFGWWFQRRGRD